eukprot:TRINITY_DN3421_c0_g2_i1.p1 TRINITY_DN3421_c0_g2~~TRINITY_DN3421_c0_g2_i1.p1  ORF type:complete len:190 (+),score=11.20 TRINITY_DN3421_c0_g2_i1:54-623(+)
MVVGASLRTSTLLWLCLLWLLLVATAVRSETQSEQQPNAERTSFEWIPTSGCNCSGIECHCRSDPFRATLTWNSTEPSLSASFHYEDYPLLEHTFNSSAQIASACELPTVCRVCLNIFNFTISNVQACGLLGGNVICHNSGGGSILGMISLGQGCPIDQDADANLDGELSNSPTVHEGFDSKEDEDEDE